MTLLTRKKQLAAVKQTGNAVNTTGLDSAANASVVVEELSSNLDVERIERTLLRDSITSVKDLPGQIAVDVSFSAELKGTRLGTHAAGAPLSWIYLEACGFRVREVQKIAIGAITATGSGSSTTFRHGEIVTQTTSGVTAVVVGDCHDSAPFLIIDKTTLGVGTITATDVWTGSDSLATTTPTVVAVDAGFAAYPITDPIKTITMAAASPTSALAIGDVLQGAASGAIGVVETAVAIAGVTVRIRSLRGAFGDGEVVNRLVGGAATGIGSTENPADEQYVDWAPLSIRPRLDGKSITIAGCRGNVVFNMEVNRQVKMAFTMRGVLSDLTDRPLIAGIQYDVSNPPLWEESVIGFAKNDVLTEMSGLDEITPCLATASLDMGVQLVDRKCAGATNGLLEVRGVDRQATGSIDPEDSLEADAGWLTAVQGGGVYRLGMTIGGTDGNRFEIRMPGVQFTSASEGDRDGFASQDMSFRITGGDIFDLDTGATGVSSIGGDNELVLIYYTS
tara:strand:- start:1134 stop:2651 length:1518 start_codon:yes stop_codon:yes gene_type:complete